ncbi:MAG: hypothetical protein QM484_02670 [Woeseiaceae bacterium]
MEHFIDLLNVVIWPVTVLIVIFLMRNPLKNLLPHIDKVKYKDFELYFKKQLEQVEEEIRKDQVIEVKLPSSNPEIIRLIDVSPSAAIIESWKKLELAAINKVKQLAPKDVKYRNPEKRPIDYLEYTGALIPSSVRAIRELRNLRNQSVHSDDIVVSKDMAKEFSSVAIAISNQIESITELPKAKLTALTILILELNHLIDSGKYNDITIDEVYKEIENKNILPFLAKRTKGISDFSLYSNNGPYSEFADFYHKQMESLYYGYSGDHRRKWGIENLGLCLLLAWTNELIQQGAGWYPSEM